MIYKNVASNEMIKMILPHILAFPHLKGHETLNGSQTLNITAKAFVLFARKMQLKSSSSCVTKFFLQRGNAFY